MRWEDQAVDFVDQWRPFGLVAGALISGILLGILLGLFACSPSGVLTGANEERYYVLAGKLYSQGESLDAMKAYLATLGSRDVSSSLIRLAEKYERNTDESSRIEARDLRQLGEAVRTGPGLFSSLARVPLPSVVPLDTQPSAATEVRAAATATPTSVPTRVPPTPTSTSPPSPGPVTGKGVARPAGGGGAILRAQPTTKSGWVASIPNGGKVEVLKVVQGEAVDPAEPRWYQVKYADKTGYVYFKLIAQGE